MIVIVMMMRVMMMRVMMRVEMMMVVIVLMNMFVITVAMMMVLIMTTLAGIGQLLGPQGPRKGSFWPPFGGLGRTWRAPGSQIWCQLPPAAVPKLDSR